MSNKLDTQVLDDITSLIGHLEGIISREYNEDLFESESELALSIRKIAQKYNIDKDDIAFNKERSKLEIVVKSLDVNNIGKLVVDGYGFCSFIDDKTKKATVLFMIDKKTFDSDFYAKFAQQQMCRNNMQGYFTLSHLEAFFEDVYNKI